MKVNTKPRKKARKGFEQAFGKRELASRMFHIIQEEKQGLDGLITESGVMIIEAIMDIEREELSGPDYHLRYTGGPIRRVLFTWGIRRFVFGIPDSGRGRFLLRRIS